MLKTEEIRSLLKVSFSCIGINWDSIISLDECRYEHIFSFAADSAHRTDARPVPAVWLNSIVRSANQPNVRSSEETLFSSVVYNS